jgi:hypothetical protein
MVMRQSQLPSGAIQQVAMQEKPKHQLWLLRMKSGSLLHLNRSRWSDRHLVGLTATADQIRRHNIVVRLLPEPIRPPPEIVRPPAGLVRPPVLEPSSEMVKP